MRDVYNAISTLILQDRKQSRYIQSNAIIVTVLESLKLALNAVVQDVYIAILKMETISFLEKIVSCVREPEKSLHPKNKRCRKYRRTVFASSGMIGITFTETPKSIFQKIHGSQHFMERQYS